LEYTQINVVGIINLVISGGMQEMQEKNQLYCTQTQIISTL